MKRIVTNIITASAHILFLGCAQQSVRTESEAKAIIASNDLQPVADKNIRGLVGKLSFKSRFCTAFVSGKNQITAAAHCLGDEFRENNIREIVFSTADGTTTGIVGIDYLDRKKDFLSLRTKVGFKNALNFGKSVGHQVTLLGYDHDRKNLYTLKECFLSKSNSNDGLFLHTCDALPGMSGSPILAEGKVVGLHLGYSKKYQRNVALNLGRMFDVDVDLSTIDLVQEGWCCKVKLPKIDNPFDGATLGAALGSLVGSPVMGAAVGALLGDRNVAENKIRELREQNQQLQAELLQSKLDVTSKAASARAEKENLVKANECLAALGEKKDLLLNDFASAHNSFMSCIQDAQTAENSQGCFDTYVQRAEEKITFIRNDTNCL